MKPTAYSSLPLSNIVDRKRYEEEMKVFIEQQPQHPLENSVSRNGGCS
jgi:hypothetical protein